MQGFYELINIVNKDDHFYKGFSYYKWQYIHLFL